MMNILTIKSFREIKSVAQLWVIKKLKYAHLSGQLISDFYNQALSDKWQLQYIMDNVQEIGQSKKKLEAF